MLQLGAALLGYAIEADDGAIGTVSEFLFDDRTWKVRWLVIDAGSWLAGRFRLLHPSAVGRADCVRRSLPVAVTRGQIEHSPNVWQHRQVSRQMEFDLYEYYGCDPAWDSSFYNDDATSADSLPSRYVNQPDTSRLETWDPHLRGLSAISGYDILGSDGPIGHVEDFVLEDDAWSVRSLIVETGDAATGKHVLISPLMLCLVDWSKQMAYVDVSRNRVNASSPWAPLKPGRRGSWFGYGSRL